MPAGGDSSIMLGVKWNNVYSRGSISIGSNGHIHVIFYIYDGCSQIRLEYANFIKFCFKILN